MLPIKITIRIASMPHLSSEAVPDIRACIGDGNKYLVSTMYQILDEDSEVSDNVCWRDV